MSLLGACILICVEMILVTYTAFQILMILYCIVGLPVTVHVRKLCSTCTVVTCCNVHITKYSIFNSALIHYLVMMNFVILSNIVILCYIYFT